MMNDEEIKSKLELLDKIRNNQCNASKKYYDKNKDIIIKKAVIYNKKRLQESEEAREKMRINAKNYYQKNRDKILAKKRIKNVEKTLIIN